LQFGRIKNIRVVISDQDDGGKVCFDFDFQFCKSSLHESKQQNEVRVVLSSQNNNNEGLFGFDFES
jgi:hypothetical protein